MQVTLLPDTIEFKRRGQDGEKPKIPGTVSWSIGLCKEEICSKGEDKTARKSGLNLYQDYIKTSVSDFMKGASSYE